MDINKPTPITKELNILNFLDVRRYLNKQECEEVGMLYPGDGCSYLLPDGSKPVGDILWEREYDSHLGNFGNDRLYLMNISEERSETEEEQREFLSECCYEGEELEEEMKVWYAEKRLLDEFGEYLMSDERDYLFKDKILFYVSW